MGRGEHTEARAKRISSGLAPFLQNSQDTTMLRDTTGVRTPLPTRRVVGKLAGGRARNERPPPDPPVRVSAPEGRRKCPFEILICNHLPIASSSRPRFWILPTRSFVVHCRPRVRRRGSPAPPGRIRGVGWFRGYSLAKLARPPANFLATLRVGKAHRLEVRRQSKRHSRRQRSATFVKTSTAKEESVATVRRRRALFPSQTPPVPPHCCARRGGHWRASVWRNTCLRGP